MNYTKGEWKATQDWEFAEETFPDEWETVDIQIDTEAEAISQAQEWANRYNCRCVVNTSIRYEFNGAVEDRGIVEGDPLPIIVTPNIDKALAKAEGKV